MSKVKFNFMERVCNHMRWCKKNRDIEVCPECGKRNPLHKDYCDKYCCGKDFCGGCLEDGSKCPIDSIRSKNN